jgi:septum formation protein
MTPHSLPASGFPRLVLASASPRRRRLLRQAGVPFTALASRYLEGAPSGDPAAFALRAARGKAADVAARLARPAWVLAADTLVVQGRRVFGKPRTRTEARSMLRALSGREHRVLTGVVLRRSSAGRGWAWVETTRVRMRRLAPRELESYLDTGEWRDKAGGYGIQERAGAFVTGIRGCYFNVVGLPLGAVCARLARIAKDRDRLTR